MIKNFRSKSLLIVLCAFFSTPAQPSDFINTLNTFATLTRSMRDTMQNIDYIANLRAGTVEDFFDNANTLTWDLFVPLYVAYYSATVVANKAARKNFSDGSALAQGAIAAVLGGGVAYVLGSIPKNLLKKLCQHFVSQKEFIEESMN